MLNKFQEMLSIRQSWKLIERLEKTEELFEEHFHEMEKPLASQNKQSTLNNLRQLKNVTDGPTRKRRQK